MPPRPNRSDIPLHTPPPNKGSHISEPSLNRSPPILGTPSLKIIHYMRHTWEYPIYPYIGVALRDHRAACKRGANLNRVQRCLRIEEWSTCAFSLSLSLDTKLGGWVGPCKSLALSNSPQDEVFVSAQLIN